MKELAQHIDFIVNAHEHLSKTPIKSVRAWDTETPYYIHPLWCTMTIASETTLPKDIRQKGMITLLYHDVIEDTDAQLPQNLPAEIQQLINDMTFKDGITQEMIEIWTKKPIIRLFKLYDKISNLLDATWMSPQLREKYIIYTKKLLQDVENNFGSLNIVKIAHALTDKQ